MPFLQFLDKNTSGLQEFSIIAANDVGINQEANGREVQATQKCAEEDHTAEKNEWDVNKYKVTKVWWEKI